MFRRKSRAQSAMSDSMLASMKVAAARGDNVRGSAAGMGMGRRVGRTQSAPSVRRQQRVSGVMKFVTADDSLHSVYGESSKHKKQSPDEKDGSRRRTISFKHIEIREYNRTVGDNPSCSSGPPITIAWEFNPNTKIISVDQYEESRPQRRTHFEMILPRDLRQKMLRKEWDVTQNQIAAAVRQNIKVKNQRRQTVQNLGKQSSKVEEALESASRSVFRGLMGKGNTDKEVAKLEKQMKQAELTRRQAELEAEMSGEYAEDNDTFELEQDLEEAEENLEVKQSPSPRAENEENLVVEETYEQEEKKQELQHTPIRSPARPVVVIEESDSEEEEQKDQKPPAHRPANPQETTHIVEEEKKKTPIVLVPAKTETKPSSSTPPSRSSTPLKNGVKSSPPPPAQVQPKQPVVPLTNGRHVSKQIPPVARVSDEDDSEEEVEC